jgi:DNA mismatch endonuclease (patch repair protein)
LEPAGHVRERIPLDTFSKARRSMVMSRVAHYNTAPERTVRAMIVCLGHPFRLHVKTLPGRPDVVLRRKRIAIFVHGCFWHGHPGCRRSVVPVTNRSFWRQKIERNVRRDRAASRGLRTAGWQVLVIWECQLKRGQYIFRRLERLLARKL